MAAFISLYSVNIHQQQRCPSPNHKSFVSVLQHPFPFPFPRIFEFASESFSYFPLMASQENGRPLPKFGEWDVNDPASADGFTVIFNKARNEKKTGGGSVENATVTSPSKYAAPKENRNYNYPKKSKWFCCF